MYDYGCYYLLLNHNRQGVISKDGKVLIPLEYETIRQFDVGRFMVSKTVDGIESVGVYAINGGSICVIPCIFKKIEFDESKGKWLVAIHEFDSLSVYDESKVYRMDFLDDGEKLFAQNKFEETREFYFLNAENTWSDFYIGATYYKEALHERQRIELLIGCLERSDNKSDAIKCDYLTNAYDSLFEKTEKAISYLELSCTENNPYYSNANRILYELNVLSNAKFSLWDCIVESIEEYKNRCEEKIRLQIELDLEVQLKKEELRLHEQQQRIRERELREQQDKERQRRNQLRKLEEEKRKREQQQRLREQQDKERQRRDQQRNFEEDKRKREQQRLREQQDKERQRRDQQRKLEEDKRKREQQEKLRREKQMNLPIR